jgi:hypothetical protein
MKMLNEVCMDRVVHHTTEEEWQMMSDLPASWDEWIYKGPDSNELLNIAIRGNSEEIVFMIEKFAKFLGNSNTAYKAYMPENVQEIIAKRNKKEEVQALVKYYGFCNQAQKVMLGTWPINDLMWYINYHGFADDGQKYIMENWSSSNVTEYIKRHYLSEVGEVALINRGYHEEIEQYMEKTNFSKPATIKLIERGNHEEVIQLLMKHGGPLCKDAEELLFLRDVKDEINFYIKFYPVSENLIMDMFDKMDKGESADRLFFYFWHHGMPANAEKRLINTPNSEVLFAEYIKRHPISFDAHEEMVLKRKPEELRFYIEMYKKLGWEGEDALFSSASFDDKMFYLNNCELSDCHVLNSILRVKPLDYEILVTAFLRCQKNLNFDGTLDCINTNDVVEKAKNGEELSKKEVVALFFAGDTKVFEDYIDMYQVVF